MRKAARPTDTPRSEAMAQGSFFLQDQGWEGVFRAQMCPNPFAQFPGMEDRPVGTESGGCVLDQFSEPPNLPPIIIISHSNAGLQFSLPQQFLPLEHSETY